MSGPGQLKSIQLGEDDPASLAVEAQMALHARGNFDSVLGPIGLGVGDRRDQQLGPPARLDTSDDHHHDRPVLQSFFLSRGGFARPQIGVGDDVSRFRYRP